LPVISSDLPKAGGPRQRFCSVLLRMGFTCALSVTRQAVVSYTALPPLLDVTKFPKEFCSQPICIADAYGWDTSSGTFLLHCPWSHLHRPLTGILPYEARTFLTCGLSTLAAAIICPTYINVLLHTFVILSYFLLKIKY